jgi:hypothetical protein
MTDRELRDAGRRLRRGEDPPGYLVDALRDAVRATMAIIRLPDAVSPYGHFGQDVHDDLCNGWIAAKLLRDGGILKLVDKAKDVSGFQFMAEQSFYQWLLNARPRSYSSNIYRRMVNKLEEQTDRFLLIRDAKRSQHRGWALVDQGAPAMFAGSDRELAAAAMTAGDIELKLWKPDSKNLDPLVGSDELMRFCEVVMRALDAAVTPEILMRALAMRVDLAEVDPDSIDEMGELGEEISAPTDIDIDEALDLRSAAINVITQITNPRWTEVIVATERRGEAGKDVAERLGVSPATVASDRKNVILLVARFAENLDAASRLLKEVVDLLYEASDG